MKKLACVLYYVMLILSVVWMIAGGTVLNADSVFIMAVTFLSMLGGGIFFFVLDKNDEASPVQSFKLQGKLNGIAVAMMMLFFLFFVVSWQGNYVSLSSGSNQTTGLTGVPLLDAFLLSLPYFILFIPFVTVFSLSFTYNSIKKEFGVSGENVDHIVAHGGYFSPMEGAKDVQRNRDHLFFGVHKCFVPLDRIAKIERQDVKLFGVLIEPAVTVTTEKGNKISIDTRDYDVLAAGLTGYEFLFEN